MCYENSLSYNHIAKAIAYGFLYDNPDDPQALLLQESIQKEGLSSVVERITGLPKTQELNHTILQHYESLKRN